MSVFVVGTDGSRAAEAAVEKVIELVRARGVAVHLVCAYPGRSTLERLGLSARQEPVDMRGVAADVLARAELRFREAGFAVDKHAREGDPAQTIIDVADEQNADLIVIGARGTGGLGRFMLGGVAAKLSHHAPSSLLIVRDD
jgi:nucleotide-binding universal stress UspA family protein